MNIFDSNKTMRLVGYQPAVFFDGEDEETRQIKDILQATSEKMTMTKMYLYSLGKIHGIRKERRKNERTNTN